MADEPWNALKATEMPLYGHSMPPPAKRRRLASPPSTFLDSGYGTRTYVDSARSAMEFSEPMPSQTDKSKKPKPSVNGYPCPTCHAVFRTESEYKKDQARHERPHKCSVNDCSHQTKGFSTVNDLNRHLKAVHGFKLAGTKDYRCFVPGCSKTDKTWPRLDNFRQHVLRMHPERNVDEVVRQSEQWYEAKLSMQTYMVMSNNDQSTDPKPKSSRALGLKRPAPSFSRGPVNMDTPRKSNGPLLIGQPRRRLSFSSAPGALLKNSFMPTFSLQHRERATEGHRTPELDAIDTTEGYDVEYFAGMTADWALGHDESAAVLGSDLASSFLNAVPIDGKAGHQRHGLAHSPILQSQPRHIVVSPPSRVVTPNSSDEEHYNRPERDDSVTMQLQRVLATYHPAAGDIFQQFGDSGDSNQFASDANQTPICTAPRESKQTQSGGRSKKRKLGSGASEKDDFGEDEGTGGSPDLPRKGDQIEGQPQRYFACPFHKHDPITYAACHGYRTKTVDALYRHHVLKYHVDRGHIDEATLVRLDNLSAQRQRSPVDRWYAIHRELFWDRFQAFEVVLPEPFWMPCISSTNLDDLVRATVELSGRAAPVAGMTAANNATVESLAPFYRRVNRVRELTDQAEELEVQQVRSRWVAVREQSLTTLATNSEFDTRVLETIPGLGRYQHTVQRALSAPEQQQEVSVPPASSPESLNLQDTYPGALEAGFPSPPVALPTAAFGMTAAEKAQSRQSTPNDSGFASNPCRWLSQDDDPALCSLCGKTRDLHVMEVIEGLWD